MSRYELAELEKELRELEDPTSVKAEFELAEGEDIPQWVEENEQFKEYKRQLRLLIPIRHATIKKYFDKFKYRKAAREDILATAEESEEFVKRIMGKEYVHFLEAIPEIKEFLDELQEKKTLKQTQKLKTEGSKEKLSEKIVDIKSLQAQNKKMKI